MCIRDSLAPGSRHKLRTDKGNQQPRYHQQHQSAADHHPTAAEQRAQQGTLRLDENGYIYINPNDPKLMVTDERIKLGSVPVSYTHLDVYKRQAYNRNPDQPSTIDRDVWDYIKSMQYNVIPTVKNQYQIVENVSGGDNSKFVEFIVKATLE